MNSTLWIAVIVVGVVLVALGNIQYPRAKAAENRKEEFSCTCSPQFPCHKSARWDRTKRGENCQLTGFSVLLKIYVLHRRRIDSIKYTQTDFKVGNAGAAQHKKSSAVLKAPEARDYSHLVVSLRYGLKGDKDL